MPVIARPLSIPISRSVFEALGGGLPWEDSGESLNPGGFSGASLNLSSGGTFTRSTEGSYLTRAPTDGSTPFLAWAGINVPRIEDRGDGFGPMLLMEGSRTNYALNSRDLVTGGWLAGSATTTANQDPGPDGAGLADRVNAATFQYGPYQVSAGQVAYSVASCWVRGVSGAVNHQIYLFQGSTGLAARGMAVTTTWARNSVAGNCTPGSAGMEPVDARDLTSVGGQTAQAQDVYVDLSQLETGYWPTSAIRSGASAATRATDVLMYAAGQYPTSFCIQGFRLQFAPDFSSAELVASGAVSTLVSFSGGAGTDRLMFSHAGGLASVYTQDSVTGAQGTGTKTWNRGQLLTITVYPSIGKVVSSGFLSGNGTANITPFAWPTGTFYVGTQLGSATGTSFGRFGLTIEGV